MPFSFLTMCPFSRISVRPTRSAMAVFRSPKVDPLGTISCSSTSSKTCRATTLRPSSKSTKPRRLFSLSRLALYCSLFLNCAPASSMSITPFRFGSKPYLGRTKDCTVRKSLERSSSTSSFGSQPPASFRSLSLLWNSGSEKPSRSSSCRLSACSSVRVGLCGAGTWVLAPRLAVATWLRTQTVPPGHSRLSPPSISLPS
mmetsp:Transcript_77597/g.175443  ORF Transcript_77597/g.175443 Transcript_77597/m.175443 type:complete len:200 (+) Transcript_77597:205-804(+)